MEGLKVKGFRCDQKLKAKSNWTFFLFRFQTTRITQHHCLPTVERWRKNTQSFHCSWWDIPWEGWYPYCLFLKPRWYFLHKIWNQDIFHFPGYLCWISPHGPSDTLGSETSRLLHGRQDKSWKHSWETVVPQKAMASMAAKVLPSFSLSGIDVKLVRKYSFHWSLEE